MSGSQSLERGLQLLDLLDTQNESQGVRELARRMDIGPATVQRLLNTFQQFGYVTQEPETRRYRIGYRAFGLGQSLLTSDRLLHVAQRELQRIATEHSLNGYLGALHGNHAIYLLCVQSPGPIAIRNMPGELAQLHATAMGKVLLAGLSDARAIELLGSEPLEALTPHTLRTVDQVLAQLPEIRSRGFSTVIEETILGVTSVGAPVYGPLNEMRASISVAFPQRSFPDLSVEDVAAILLPAARAASMELGWSGR